MVFRFGNKILRSLRHSDPKRERQRERERAGPLLINSIKIFLFILLIKIKVFEKQDRLETCFKDCARTGLVTGLVNYCTKPGESNIIKNVRSGSIRK